jgi:hypothetical protein
MLAPCRRELAVGVVLLHVENVARADQLADVAAKKQPIQRRLRARFRKNAHAKWHSRQAVRVERLFVQLWPPLRLALRWTEPQVSNEGKKASRFERTLAPYLRLVKWWWIFFSPAKSQTIITVARTPRARQEPKQKNASVPFSAFSPRSTFLYLYTDAWPNPVETQNTR